MPVHCADTREHAQGQTAVEVAVANQRQEVIAAFAREGMLLE
jgi:hypothetical protein